MPDGESGQSCGGPELEGSGWPRYIRTPPGGSPSPGSPSVSRGHCYDDYVPRVNWLEGRPPGRAKVDPEESHNQLPPWRNYRVLMLSLVCGYVSAVFIEVAIEAGRIGRLISDRITAEVSQMSRSDFGNREWVPAWQAKRRGGICRASPPWRVYPNYPSVCASSIASGGS